LKSVSGLMVNPITVFVAFNLASATCLALSVLSEFATAACRALSASAAMTRASEGAGGAMVNAMAYQDRYNTARAEMRALRKAGEAKKCSPSDLNPPPAAPPD
jgi:hypothetical protein